MKPPVWIPLAFMPVHLLVTYFAGEMTSRGSWVGLAVPTMLLVGIPSIALMWAAWGLLSWRTPPGATGLLVGTGLALPFVCGGLILGTLRVIEETHDARRLDQLAHSRAFDITDEPLLGRSGNPIGVRLRYKVRFEKGLDDVRFHPFAMLHAESPPENLLASSVVVKPSALDRYEARVYEFTEDFIPSFLPRFMRFPQLAASTDGSDHCFEWGNDAIRSARLDAPPQRLMLRVEPLNVTQATTRDYSWSTFIDGAKREGARDC
jgi:hypothetical protein